VSPSYNNIHIDYYVCIYILTGLGIDFDTDQFNITINPRENFGSFNISITCDHEPEESESFNVKLTSNNPLVYISEAMALVRIIDSTGKMMSYHCKVYT